MSRILAVIASGRVENMIVGAPGDFPDAIDVTEANPRPAPGWMFDGEAFSAPVESEPSPPTRRVTRLAFDNRFTQDERIGIDMASIDNPQASYAQRQLQAALRDMRRQVNNATFIDLDRLDTRAGVQQLENIGLLATGRAAEILDNPVQQAEAYAG